MLTENFYHIIGFSFQVKILRLNMLKTFFTFFSEISQIPGFMATR